MITGSSRGEANHERSRSLAAEELGAPITDEVDAPEGAPAR